MKCCVSTDVGTWTNVLTFEPDPDYSPDAGTGLLSVISYALQRGILLHRENSTFRYWAPAAAATRGFTRSSAIADKPRVLDCKVVEVWQDFLSEYVDIKFTYILCYKRLIRHE